MARDREPTTIDRDGVYRDRNGLPTVPAEGGMGCITVIVMVMFLQDMFVQKVNEWWDNLYAQILSAVDAAVDATIAFLIVAVTYTVLLFFCLPWGRNRYIAIFQSYAVVCLLNRLHGDLPSFWWIALLIPCMHLIPAIRERNFWYTWVYCGTGLVGSLPIVFPSLQPYFLIF